MKSWMLGAALTGALLLAAPVSYADMRLPLPQATADQVGMSPKKLERIREALKQEVDKGNFPGAVVMVARKGKLVYAEAVGMQDAEGKKPMAADAVFQFIP